MTPGPSSTFKAADYHNTKGAVVDTARNHSSGPFTNQKNHIWKYIPKQSVSRNLKTEISIRTDISTYRNFSCAIPHPQACFKRNICDNDSWNISVVGLRFGYKYHCGGAFCSNHFGQVECVFWMHQIVHMFWCFHVFWRNFFLTQELSENMYGWTTAGAQTSMTWNVVQMLLFPFNAVTGVDFCSLNQNFTSAIFSNEKSRIQNVFGAVIFKHWPFQQNDSMNLANELKICANPLF